MHCVVNVTQRLSQCKSMGLLCKRLFRLHSNSKNTVDLKPVIYSSIPGVATLENVPVNHSLAWPRCKIGKSKCGENLGALVLNHFKDINHTEIGWAHQSWMSSLPGSSFKYVSALKTALDVDWIDHTHGMSKNAINFNITYLDMDVYCRGASQPRPPRSPSPCRIRLQTAARGWCRCGASLSDPRHTPHHTPSTRSTSSSHHLAVLGLIWKDKQDKLKELIKINGWLLHLETNNSKPIVPWVISRCSEVSGPSP